MTYSLGPVKPWVKAAAEEVGPKFGIKTVYGWATSDRGPLYGYRDHPLGLALDFMVSGLPNRQATGDSVANYCRANHQRLSVHYVIWNRRIWNVDRDGEGWRPYSGTSNPHTDHVHVSFLQSASAGGPVVDNAGLSIPNPLAPLEDLASTVTNSLAWFTLQNFIRLGEGLLGLALIIVGLFQFDQVRTVATTVASVGKAVK